MIYQAASARWQSYKHEGFCAETNGMKRLQIYAGGSSILSNQLLTHMTTRVPQAQQYLGTHMTKIGYSQNTASSTLWLEYAGDHTTENTQTIELTSQ